LRRTPPRRPHRLVRLAARDFELDTAILILSPLNLVRIRDLPPAPPMYD